VPLLAETLPALKITEFCGAPARGTVYAYLRCYVHRGSLHYSVYVFDEAPPATARVGLAITADSTASRYLFLSLSAAGSLACSLYAHTPGQDDTPLQAVEAPPVRTFGGADEQGGYWGAQGVLPAELWQSCFGSTPQAGSVLPGNVFLYDTQQPAFGAAFAAPANAHIPTAQGFSSFVVVPY
jgi:hypothetical protein